MEKRRRRRANGLGKMPGKVNPLPRISVAVKTFGTTGTSRKVGMIGTGVRIPVRVSGTAGTIGTSGTDINS